MYEVYIMIVVVYKISVNFIVGIYMYSDKEYFFQYFGN